MVPGAATGANAVQVPSGVGLSPVRKLSVRLVPVGVVVAHWIVRQLTDDCASNTRDRNVPDAAYGVMRIQSTNTVPPNGVKSLAATGRISAETVTLWVATSAPST